MIKYCNSTNEFFKSNKRWSFCKIKVNFDNCLIYCTYLNYGSQNVDENKTFKIISTQIERRNLIHCLH